MPWEALFVFDSIVFGFTLNKVWSTRREYFMANRNVPPLMTLVYRDGGSFATLFQARAQ